MFSNLLNTLSYLIASFLFITLLACNDRGELGEDIIDPVRFGTFKDDFGFEARTMNRDSTFSRDYFGYVVGRTSDPVFGTYEAGFYSQLSIIPFDTVFSNYVVDSAYMYLLFDTLRYGDTANLFDIYIHRLLEDPNLDEDQYSNKEYEISTDPIGLLEGFIPEFNKTVTIDDTVVITVNNQIRIPLDEEFAEELLSYDSASYASNLAFQENFKGIYVKSGEENEAMLSFSLFQIMQNDFSTRMVVHFTSNEVSDSFQMNISTVDFRLGYYSKDEQGVEIEPFIGDFELGEEKLFVSGLAENYIELNLDEANEFLSDKLINHAEICLPLNTDGSYDYDLYPAASELDPIYVDTLGGTRFQILDDGQSYFDNRLLRDSLTNSEQYCINITGHMQQMRKGDVNTKLQLFTGSNSESQFEFNSPNKAVINGPNHSSNPSRLIVYYSEPQ